MGTYQITSKSAKVQSQTYQTYMGRVPIYWRETSYLTGDRDPGHRSRTKFTDPCSCLLLNNPKVFCRP